MEPPLKALEYPTVSLGAYMRPRSDITGQSLQTHSFHSLKWLPSFKPHGAKKITSPANIGLYQKPLTVVALHLSLRSNSLPLSRTRAQRLTTFAKQQKQNCSTGWMQANTL